MLTKYLEDPERLYLCPSLLAADFSRLAEEVAKVEGEMDWLHLDVMDGHFVPNISFGPAVISQLRPLSQAKFDVHLMVSEPERWLEPMAKAGADSFVFHPEAVIHGHRLIGEIRKAGMSPGLALNPGTSLTLVEEYLPMIDVLLIMTVNPGFGGQSYLAEMEDKIKRARALIRSCRYDVHLEVDGGIGPKTFPAARAAGANAFVMGSACFKEADPRAFLKQMRA